ncbi:fibronectin-domain containing protein [Echinococcus multilocularis]|uniref:Fibronectin-domain containing protein n=1 Tax=Echinococcus multilocularis TaxID=6211 RepID=A0A068YEI0_ECHMU|nr:fibronectin-domain containing protein [Echinococcus multilocularis]
MKMSTPFHLMLLAISVLAGSQGGVDGEKKDISQLPKHFHWGEVGPHTIELEWEVEKLGSDYADSIALIAEPASSLASPKRKEEDFKLGKLALDGLYPKTLYNVTMEVLRKHDLLTSSEGQIETKPTGFRGTGKATSTPV